MDHLEENAKARGKFQELRVVTAYQDGRALTRAILPEGVFVFGFVLCERAFRLSATRKQSCCGDPPRSTFLSGDARKPT